MKSSTKEFILPLTLLRRMPIKSMISTKLRDFLRLGGPKKIMRQPKVLKKKALNSNVMIFLKLSTTTKMRGLSRKQSVKSKLQITTRSS